METGEENRVLLRRFVDEVINTGDVGLVSGFVREDFVDHDPPPGASPDISGIGQAFTRVRASFPDFRAEVEDLVSEGDRVAYRWTFRGTHLGDFGGIPPTGRVASWEVIGIARFAEGKMVERWQRLDTAGLLGHLGGSSVVPQDAEGRP
jgi:predicted ester cyclase